MRSFAMLMAFSVVAICGSQVYAQSSVPTPSQSQVDFVKECMRKQGVVLKEPPKGGSVVMTDQQKKVVEQCAMIVAQDLALDAAQK